MLNWKAGASGHCPKPNFGTEFAGAENYWQPEISLDVLHLNVEKASNALFFDIIFVGIFWDTVGDTAKNMDSSGQSHLVYGTSNRPRTSKDIHPRFSPSRKVEY